MRNILLYGYGREGQSSERFLQKHAPTSAITIYDENIESYAHTPQWEHSDSIILSPGIPRERIPEAYHDRVTSNTELFFKLGGESLRTKVIGITGTKGKTTTAKFLYELLLHAGKKACIAGNYGVPLLDVFEEGKAADFIVAELSSYQLEHLTISPHIGIVLNLYADHLDRHKTRQNYLHAKANLWAHQTSEDMLIAAEGIGDPLPEKVKIAPPLPTHLLPPENLLRADHFRRNLGTIHTLCDILNIPEKDIEATAQDFIFPPHRLQKIAKINGYTLYDDAISTTPESTLAAMHALRENLSTVFLGGQDRGADYAGLIRTIERDFPQVYIILLPSELQPKLLALLEASSLTFSVAASYQTALQISLTQTPKGAVLLSTAAPSYDRFRNYEEQGQYFQALVGQFHTEPDT